MKIYLPKLKNLNLMLSLFAGSALLAGCAGLQHQVTLDPVGPSHVQTAINTTRGNGSLVVFSAPDVSPEVSFESTYIAKYSSYKVLLPNGKTFKTVANNSATFVSHPEQVELPAGKYNVIAQSKDYGRVTVPVVVAANQLTVVELDGDKFWSQLLGLNQSNTVQLPGGQPVGWRAASATP